MNKKQPLFRLIFLAIGCFFLLYSVTLVFLFHERSSEKKEQLFNEIISQMNQTIIEKTTNYLMPAIMVAESSSRLIHNGILSPENVTQIENYCLSLIKPHPQLTKFYFGNTTGKFVMVYRDKGNTITTKVVNAQTQQSFYKYRNTIGNLTKTSKKKTTYDARKRPWYQGAKDSEERFWTDIYIFFTGKKPGITAAYPSFDAKDRFNGVFGVDIELAELSGFLKAQLKFKGSRILIINNKDQVVAQPNDISFRTLENGDVEPLHIREFNDDLVKKAFDIHKETFADRFKLNDEKKSYLASFSPFPEYFGKKWKIIILVPEDKLFGPSNEENAISYTVIGSFFLGLLIILIWLSKIISKPLTQLTKDMERLYYGNSDGKPIESNVQQIDDLVNVYNKYKEKFK